MSLSNKQNSRRKPISNSEEIWKILKKMAKSQEEVVKSQEEITKHQEEAAKHQEEAAKHQEGIAKHQEGIVKHQEGIVKHQEEAIKFHKETVKYQEETTKLHKETTKLHNEEIQRLHQRSQRMEIIAERMRLENEKRAKESEKRAKENEKQINKMRGVWSNAWGDFVESLVRGRFVELIQEWIPSVNQMMKNIECKKRDGRHCEIDIIAVNNDSLVATEVKSTLSVKDVQEFLEKLKYFTMFFPQFKNYKIYGAVAYLKTTQNAEKFAMKQGLFVIHATGDSGEILNEKGVFKPQTIKQIHFS